MGVVIIIKNKLNHIELGITCIFPRKKTKQSINFLNSRNRKPVGSPVQSYLNTLNLVMIAVIFTKTKGLNMQN